MRMTASVFAPGSRFSPLSLEDNDEDEKEIAKAAPAVAPLTKARKPSIIASDKFKDSPKPTKEGGGEEYSLHSVPMGPPIDDKKPAAKEMPKKTNKNNKNITIVYPKPQPAVYHKRNANNRPNKTRRYAMAGSHTIARMKHAALLSKYGLAQNPVTRDQSTTEPIS